MHRAAHFAAVLSTLHAAHDLADHVVQTDAQALGKTAPSGWAAPMAGHVGGYHAVQLAALVVADRVLGLGLRPGRVALAVAVSAGTHAFLDRRWPVRRVLDLTGSYVFARGTFVLVPRNLVGDPESVQTIPLHGPYLADQALHHACLWLAALIAAGP